jgi:hypothetical protein
MVKKKISQKLREETLLPHQKRVHSLGREGLMPSLLDFFIKMGNYFFPPLSVNYLKFGDLSEYDLASPSP